MKNHILKFLKKAVLTIQYLLVTFLLVTCGGDDSPNPSNDPNGQDPDSDPNPVDNSELIVIPNETTDTLLYFQSTFDNASIPVQIVFPVSKESQMPAVAVFHGSGGGWDDDDTDNDGIEDVAYPGELSAQNEEWAELLTDEGYVAAFPESFYARGTVEAHGEWDEPPLKLKICAQGPRSRDAIQTLELLCSLVDESGNKWIDCEHVGAVGFSDGATTVVSALYDHPSATPVGFEWLYDGEQFPEPESTSDHPTYAAGVAKYGGGGHHGYFGSISNCENNIYRPYCPLRLELGEEDGLTKNNLKLIECMEDKGVKDLEYHVYIGADHGFDRKDAINGPMSRKHTLNFLEGHLKD